MIAFHFFWHNLLIYSRYFITNWKYSILWIDFKEDHRNYHLKMFCVTSSSRPASLNQPICIICLFIASVSIYHSLYTRITLSKSSLDCACFFIKFFSTVKYFLHCYNHAILLIFWWFHIKNISYISLPFHIRIKYHLWNFWLLQLESFELHKLFLCYNKM